jgi:hypothetical protein
MYRSRCSFVGAAYLLSYRKTPILITLAGITGPLVLPGLP